MFGLCFVDDSESARFAQAVKARRTPGLTRPPRPTFRAKPLKYFFFASTRTARPTLPVAAPSPPPPAKDSSSGKKKDKGARKFSRSDIGTPKDFQHVSHIGVDPTTGKVDIPPDWLPVLKKANISEVRARPSFREPAAGGGGGRGDGGAAVPCYPLNLLTFGQPLGSGGMFL